MRFFLDTANLDELKKLIGDVVAIFKAQFLKDYSKVAHEGALPTR